MARKPQIPKRDAERALKVLEYERKSQRVYSRQANPFGAYVLLLLGLVIAVATVYYVLNHKEQFARLWHRATHPETPSAEVSPDQ